MEQKRGFYITFSGVDGAGKSTQAQLLSKKLEANGYLCCVQDQYARLFHTITNTNLWNHASIRNSFCTETAEVLMLCDELLNFYSHTLPLLERGTSVISARSIIDRYLKAKLYGASNAADIETICNFLPQPNLHFYLKVNLEQCLRRIDQRGIDSEDSYLMKRYIELADREAQKRNWIMIDGSNSIHDISTQIESIVRAAWDNVR